MSAQPRARASAREIWWHTLHQPRVRRALGAFVACAAASVAAMLYGFSAWRETSAIERDLAARYDLAARERGRAALVRAVRDAMANVASIEKKLAVPAVQTTLVSQLNSIARRDGVRILVSTYEQAKSTEGSQSWSHDLTAEADYAALRRFVSDLRSMPTLTVIREASLTSAGDGVARVTARLHMVTYHVSGEGR
jgi:hypothetical protein